jgi:hypothetical protein
VLQTTIAAIAQNTSYWNTLTGTDQVKIGGTKDPHVFPAVRIHGGALQSTYAQSPPLNSYGRPMLFTIWIYAQVTDDRDESTRLKELFRLAADVQKSLEAIRGQSVDYLDIQVEQMDEFINLAASMASMPLSVSVYTRTQAGVA